MPFKGPSNQFLISLAESERDSLIGCSELVAIAPRQTLAEPGERLEYVYFPTAGVVSRLGTTSDGRSIELACTGREGAVGTLTAMADAFVPYRLLMQLPGSAYRVPAADLRRRAAAGASLRHVLSCHALMVVTQLTQAAVCARFHTSRQRLARWLLTASERAGVRDLPWSHEWVAEMVGGPRSAISTAAGSLKDEQIISYRRRGITVLDHERLELAACECVDVIRRAVDHFVARCSPSAATADSSATRNVTESRKTQRAGMSSRRS